MRTTFCSLVAALLIGCAPSTLDELQPPAAPPNTVRLVVENSFHGSALLRLYLYRGGQRERVGNIERWTQTFVLRGIQSNMADMYLVLEAQFEETWVSDNLYFVEAGDCIVLRAGVKPEFSSVLLCD